MKIRKNAKCNAPLIISCIMNRKLSHTRVMTAATTATMDNGTGKTKKSNINTVGYSLGEINKKDPSRLSQINWKGFIFLLIDTLHITQTRRPIKQILNFKQILFFLACHAVFSLALHCLWQSYTSKLGVPNNLFPF